MFLGCFYFSSFVFLFCYYYVALCALGIIDFPPVRYNFGGIDSTYFSFDDLDLEVGGA